MRVWLAILNSSHLPRGLAYVPTYLLCYGALVLNRLSNAAANWLISLIVASHNLRRGLP